MSDTQNVPAIKKALQALEQFKNKSMAFARKEDFEAVGQQFQPLVTIVTLMPADFTDMGRGNMYPGKSAVNRIGDATGVSFIEDAGGTTEIGNASTVKFVKQEGGYYQVEGKYEIVGRAQGTRLKPDGTPRPSSPSEYGFDVVGRTNAELVRDAQGDKKLTNELAARAKFLELQKFGRQKARTGAELGVIRELAGVPTGFKKEQINQNGPTDMLFSQIIENNQFRLAVLQEVLKTPDGRASVVQALFGQSREVFGPEGAPQIAADTKRQLTGGDGTPLGEEAAAAPAAEPPLETVAEVAAAHQEAAAAPASGITTRTFDPESGERLAPAGQPDLKGKAESFDDDIPWDTTEEMVTKLQRCLKIKNLHPHAVHEINALLDPKRPAKPTEKDLQGIINRTTKWLKAKGIALPWEGELPGLSS